ncbi:hypothetical protein DB31_6183 [Hyalangium minutum]|uniref:Uncharacterized protein n=1 Tax=Hyalangium minutum TaxID=394096 RepID=A0A085VTX3_9BACT|nr:hypothetical protein DB31_6183 [Hyalangium minutum]
MGGSRLDRVGPGEGPFTGSRNRGLRGVFRYSTEARGRLVSQGHTCLRGRVENAGCR